MLARLLIASLTAAATLALAAGVASAKEVMGATVCGVADCATASKHDLDPGLVEGATTASTPESGEAWYRATIKIGAPDYSENFTTVVLPESGLLRYRDEYGGFSWTTMSADGRSAYRELTSGIDPFPPALLKGVADPEPAAAEPVSNQAPAAPAAPADDGGFNALPWLIGLAALAALVAATQTARSRPRSASSR